MRERLAWPNVERGVRTWLAGRLPGLPVFTETGATVPGEYVKLARAGGSAEDLDRRVVVELEVYARTRGRMWDIVREVDTAMHHLAAHGHLGFYVDLVEVDFDWDDDPLPNQDVRRATSQYALTIRPSRA